MVLHPCMNLWHGIVIAEGLRRNDARRLMDKAERWGLRPKATTNFRPVLVQVEMWDSKAAGEC